MKTPRDARRDAMAAGTVVLAVTSGLLLACAGLWFLGIPWYVRRECLQAAESYGVGLTMDDVSVDLGGVHLGGARAAASDIPGALLLAARLDVEIDASWTSFHVTRLVATGARLTLSGSWATVAAGVDRFRTRAAGVARAGGQMPPTLVLDDSLVTWNGLSTETASLSAAATHAEVTNAAASSAQIRASSPHAMVNVAGGALGPWRLDADSSAGVSRFRVGFDPALPDACTALYVADAQRIISLDVSIPRSPMARLGLSPAVVGGVLGLHGAQPAVAANIHYAAPGTGRAEATISAGLYGLSVAAISQPVDTTLDVSAAGDPRALAVERGRLALGPLAGNVTGTVGLAVDGLRANLSWRAGPVPCSAFEPPATAAVRVPTGDPGADLAASLRHLADATGLTRVTGTVAASGRIAIDTRDLARTTLSFVPDARCSLALFASP